MQRQRDKGRKPARSESSEIYADKPKQCRLESLGIERAGDTENFAPVVGYEGRYAIGDRGTVVSLNYKNTGRAQVLKTALSDGRYLAVKLTKDGVAKDHKIHLLVLRAFRGPAPVGLEGNHEDGVKTNNRLDNLVYRTKSYNERHKHLLGLVDFRGQNNPNATLTQHEIDSLPELRKSMKVRDIADRYGVTQTTIYNYLRRLA